LLIWHVDDSKAGNTQEWYPTKQGLINSEHYTVALEQADGFYQLEDTSHPTSNYGDGGDPFPGTTSQVSFNAVSSPNSDAYVGGTSFVSVDNISVVSDTIEADLLVGFASGIGDDDDYQLPNSIDLAQNYPNPFNPSTTISFNAESSAHVSLEVYNIVGQRIKTLYDGFVPSGQSEFSWDGRDENGTAVASGVYLYRLSQDDEVQTRKMVMLK